VDNLVGHARFAAAVGGEGEGLAQCLHDAFVQTDAQFRAWALENENISGSTAIVCLLKGDSLVVANCGGLGLFFKFVV
jgi:hypothetical protein